MSFRNEFEKARDFLILHRSDYNYASSHFQWPRFENFNWALDYFDPMATENSKMALLVADEKGHEKRFSFSEISKRSNQVANFLSEHGLRKGDSLFLVMNDDVAFYELLLAAMKIGAVIIPNNPLLSQLELMDRIGRESIKMIATSGAHADKFDISAQDVTGVLVDGDKDGWVSYQAAFEQSAHFVPLERTLATDPLFRYFTSSNASKPRIVEHGIASFTVGHLSTMYWMGLRPGDVHLGVNSMGWSMHDWNSFVAPWNAEATIFIFKQKRFNAGLLLDAMEEYKVTTFCAPPTVWRMLCKEKIEDYHLQLREALSTGEALSADVISTFKKNWNIFIRDGYGQTETSTLIGITPDQKDSFGTMGRALPGFDIKLLNADGEEAEQGEVCVDLSNHPWGVMSGVSSDDKFYRTGDVAFKDESGNFTFCQRVDNLFKSSDYRISPSEIEAILKTYPCVLEAVVIPSADPLRDTVPKALITLSKGTEPTKELAIDLMNFSRTKLSPFKRIRRIEFMDIPKNTSGEILRAELIQIEKERRRVNLKATYEFWEEDAKITIVDTWAQELP